MTSKKLQRARDFAAKYIPYVAEELPKFHVTGGIGWINDPNGFAPYKGEYHLFYQYHPYDVKWGPMHWGHVKTKDFIRWERLPVALAPDMDYDKDGCFSGSAVETPDGRHLLMYTGVRNVRRRNGKVESIQTQCIAIGDGVNYEKYSVNPVIRSEDLPEGGSVHDFRDPKIWRENDMYYAVIGNRTADGSGTVLLYRSKDARNWEFVNHVASCHNQYGKMWECPDFFTLDGKDVLLVSPQEMSSIGLEFHPGNANICLIGSFDREVNHLMRENVQAIDYGLDFYAPQTLLTEDGRRIMIAWMQNWETSGSHLQSQRFLGQMTLPRELSIRGGRLCQNPVREIENYRSIKIAYQNVMMTGEISLQGINGRFIDMTVTIRPGNEASMYRWFKINVARDGEHCTSLRFKPATNIIRIDRTQSGLPCDIVNVREFAVHPVNGALKLRLIMDRYSLEVFVNDGEQAASTVIYTPLEAKSISFSCDGTVLMDVEKYDIIVD